MRIVIYSANRAFSNAGSRSWCLNLELKLPVYNTYYIIAWVEALFRIQYMYFTGLVPCSIVVHYSSIQFRSSRLAAYRQYTHWIHQRMGRGRRCMLHELVIRKILWRIRGFQWRLLARTNAALCRNKVFLVYKTKNKMVVLSFSKWTRFKKSYCKWGLIL